MYLSNWIILNTLGPQAPLPPTTNFEETDPLTPHPHHINDAPGI